MNGIYLANMNQSNNIQMSFDFNTILTKQRLISLNTISVDTSYLDRDFLKIALNQSLNGV